MLSLFQRSPIKQLQKQHDMLVTKAFQAQRNGNIREYSLLTAEAETLLKELEVMKAQQAG